MPPVWKMVEEAVESIGGEVSYPEIKTYILERWPGVNEGTITAQTIILCVNHDSRKHYPQNQQTRVTDGTNRYDVLFHTREGHVEKYDKTKHGLWEIAYVDGSPIVRRAVNKTYLFVWNPKHWEWEKLKKNKHDVDNYGTSIEQWSCGNTTKGISGGERFFMVKVGELPKGLFAAGYIKGPRYIGKHWKTGEDYNCVDLEFETLLNPNTDTILTIAELTQAGLTEQDWLPMASGISIKTDYSKKLEELWLRRTFDGPATINQRQQFLEGGQTHVLQTRYERNPYARQECLRHYGYDCAVCELNFESKYGEIGKDFIHVHHLVEVSAREGRHMINPVDDLRPVCPNCHAMLHKRNPAFTLDELKTRLRTG